MNRVITREESFTETEVKLHEALFFNGNGYIGVRGTLEEGVPPHFNTMRGMYLNGVYEIIPMKQAESLCNLIEKKQTMLNVADTQTIRLSLAGEYFTLGEGEVLENTRLLDMEAGVTKRQIRWRSPKGKEVRIETKRMASFRTPELFTIEYRVTPLNFSGEVQLDSLHIADVRNYSNPDDPRLAAESPAYLTVQKLCWEDGVSVALSETGVSGIRVCSAVSHRFSAPGKAELEFLDEEASDIFRLTAEAKQEETVTLLKYTVFSDSIREKDPEQHARTVMRTVRAEEPEAIYDAQKEYLRTFWHQSGMEIEGDKELDAAVSFNMYALLQSAPRDRYCSIAAKGLSGEGYEGHYFWDTEMYMEPFFVLTNPALARTILSYRYTTLPKARENAALVGHRKGALYPWRTITGEECSGYFPSGTAAYHINGAVAYAIVQYYLTTGDLEFILSQGAEIMLETARLWMDVGNYDRAGRFVIHEVTGPDEYTCMVDNNYYTNCCAKYNLRWAARIFTDFGETEEIRSLKKTLSVTEEELAEMKRAASDMYLPYDEELGINPQDDSFLEKPVWDLNTTPKDRFPLLLHYHPLHLYRYQVCKQADTVLAHFLFPEEQSLETMEKSFRYYEKITTHDSSLSTCVFSMTASMLGLRREALSYFGDSAKLDLMNTHGNSGDGVHTANMGGCYMAIVHGFAGLRVGEEDFSIAPYVPEGLTSYLFSFRYRGSLIRLSVFRDEIRLTLLEGEAVSFRYGGRRHRLTKESVFSTTQEP